MKAMYSIHTTVSVCYHNSYFLPSSPIVLCPRYLRSFPPCSSSSNSRLIGEKKSPNLVFNRREITRASSMAPSPITRASSMAPSPITRASSMAPSPTTDSKPYSVLFVCLGNICRSPAAEGVFRDLVNSKGFDSQFTIDSAGTINYHQGNPADSRMRSAAKRRGVEITSISRPLRPSDFKDFDLILAMDKQNQSDIFDAFDRWKERDSLPDDAYKKVKLMCSYCKKHNEEEVPDPYYGGPQGFEKVLDLLEDACGSLLDSLVSDERSK